MEWFGKSVILTPTNDPESEIIMINSSAHLKKL